MTTEVITNHVVSAAIEALQKGLAISFLRRC